MSMVTIRSVTFLQTSKETNKQNQKQKQQKTAKQTGGGEGGEGRRCRMYGYIELDIVIKVPYYKNNPHLNDGELKTITY